jgi:hypothetical protein
MAVLRAAIAILLAGVAVPAAGQEQPHVRVGRIFEADFTATAQIDWRGNASERRAVRLRRARMGVEGTLLRRIDYQIEGDVEDPADRWRDVYLNVTATRRLEVRAGHFKMPFSAGRLTPVMQQDFVYRPLAAAHLAPGRAVGVMAHGTIRRGLKYQAGMFDRDGAATAGRLTVTPRSGVTLGASFTAGTVAEGLRNATAERFDGTELFHPVYVNGRRTRASAEAEWRYHRLTLTTEMIRLTDERRRQGMDEEDLPLLVSEGWHASAMWRLSGTRKAERVEVGGRLERLRMRSASGGDVPNTSSRAAAVLTRGLTALTLGVNWHVRPWIIVQANAIRDRSWLPIVRLQVGI